MSLLEIVLAIFLPPAAVALRFGIGGKFFVNLILTLIVFVPGVIHAFYLLSRR